MTQKINLAAEIGRLLIEAYLERERKRKAAEGQALATVETEAQKSTMQITAHEQKQKSPTTS